MARCDMPTGAEDVRFRGEAISNQPRAEMAQVTLNETAASPCHSVVDLAAKRNKIDGLCQECLGTAFHGFSPGIRVAIGGDHDDGDVRSRSLGLRQ